jgi:hypothetical protein
MKEYHYVRERTMFRLMPNRDMDRFNSINFQLGGTGRTVNQT